MRGNSLRWAIVLGALILGALALAPTFIDAGDGALDGEIPAATRQGPAHYVLDYVSPLTLGLDLQGGLLLQYNVLVDKAIQDKLDRTADDAASRAEDGLKKLKANNPSDAELAKLTDADVKVTARHPKEEVLIELTFNKEGLGSRLLSEKYIQESFPEYQRRDINAKTYALVMRQDAIDETRKRVVEEAIKTIRQRVDGLGVAEPSITRRGTSDIVVQLPGLKEKDVERAKKMIGQTAQLIFRMVDDDATNNFFGQFRGQLPKGFKLRRVDGKYLSVTHADKEMLRRFLEPKLDDKHTLGFERVPIYKDAERKELDEARTYWKTYYVKRKIELTGDHVDKARVQIDQQFNTPYVGIDFTNEGGKLFGTLSSQNVNKRMAIMLDEDVKSAPVFNEAIMGGSARITLGSMRGYTELMAESQDLVTVITHGALLAPIEKQFETVVGPSLGQDSIDSSVLALGIAGLLIVCFMLIYYRASGLISVLALLFNVVFIMAGLAAFGATLTLPGIAGIILTIGMAVDANIIIFERIREELLDGQRAREAVAAGFDKAFSAVFDANITTGIAGLVLLQFGTGPIKGFAVTLLIGILSTMFTAIFVSRLLFETWVTGERAQKNELSI